MRRPPGCAHGPSRSRPRGRSTRSRPRGARSGECRSSFRPRTWRRATLRPSPRCLRRSRRCSRARRAGGRPPRHALRAPARCRSPRPEPPPPRDSRAVAAREARGGTLVVGGGFAGAYVARLLETRGATIVSPENFMLFTPLLPEAASGTLEPRHVVVPLRLMCPHSELLLGSVTGLDADKRTVAVDAADGPFEVGYDHLVLAIGSIARTLPIPGLAEHGLGFKDLADAIALRNHVLGQLEAAAMAGEDSAARHLTFVFVGAGYAGVEALAELSDLVSDAMRHYPELHGRAQRWVLVDAAPKILPEIPSRLGDYAAEPLA